MALTIFARWWHQTLGRPFVLARTIDKGSGVPIVLLHGIGSSGQVWQHVVDLLYSLGVRVVAFDLLGFGASPKPKWLNYDVDDHARAVIAGLDKLKLDQQVVLVGHSMGCLVAVRVARLRPDLVKHLVLYEMPLYEGLPQKRRYRWRADMYLRLYARIMNYQPSFDPDNMRRAERLVRKVTGLDLDARTWPPFIRSLENTIMKQTAAEDIKQLAMPMDVIYGSFDMVVIRGKPQHFFGNDNENIVAHTIRARHVISLKASKFIVARIQASLIQSMVG